MQIYYNNMKKIILKRIIEKEIAKMLPKAKGLRENYYPNPSFEKRMNKGVQKFGCNFEMKSTNLNFNAESS